jgi:N-acetylmuramoyl-L-alanine amidase
MPTPATGFIAEFASAAKVDGTSIIIELGAQAGADERGRRPHGRIDYVRTHCRRRPPYRRRLPYRRPRGPSNHCRRQDRRPAPAGPPQIDLTPGLRTIAIDAGHGGDDAGAIGTNGAKEKDLTLQLARRLKATIEARTGPARVDDQRWRRNGDTRPAGPKLANNNKADAFISLHANWSVRTAARGVQI